MTDELVEIPRIFIFEAELFTVESAFVGFLCLEGEENKDWITLGNRDRLNWELN